MFNWLKKIYKKSKSRVIGIDLGTSMTRICVKNSGMVLSEATLICYNTDKDKNNYFYGNYAKKLIGKIPIKIKVIEPLKNGVVSHFFLAEDMLRAFIIKATHGNVIFSPIAIVIVPFETTDVEKKTVQEITERCGVKDVFLIHRTIASAIGANLPVNKPEVSLIVDVGAGLTEISVISSNGIIYCNTFKYGGQDIDLSIKNYILNKYDVLISNDMCMVIKKQIATLYLKQNEEKKMISIYGRNLNINALQEIVVDQNDIVIACAEFTNLLIKNLKSILESVTPELIKDFKQNGITICGGVSRIGNLSFIIEQVTGLSCNIAQEPEFCTIKGLQKVVENYKNYKHFLFKQF